jgi:hypothetical protein
MVQQRALAHCKRALTATIGRGYLEAGIEASKDRTIQILSC